MGRLGKIGPPLEVCGDRWSWQTNMRMVKAIQEGEWPLTQNEIMSLFGLANYYQRFFRDFSKVVRTLFNLVKINKLKNKIDKKRLSQEWDEPCHQAFGEFKKLGVDQDGWPLHMRALSLMVVKPCSASTSNDYPKIGMSLATKSLGSLRASCFRHLYFKFADFDKPFEVHTEASDVGHWQIVDARWMAIAFKCMKLDGCEWTQPTHEQYLTL